VAVKHGQKANTKKAESEK